MTTTPPAHLRLSTDDTEDADDAGDTVRIELQGDLDHDTADGLLAAVTTVLGDHPRLDDLHLHCAGLGTVDSLGLSVLLMIRRRTGHAGVRLHLDDRPAALDRLLALTGTLDHLTTSSATAAGPFGAEDPPRTGGNGKAMTVRPTGPDGTT
ncbi:STAS domain-containing protein [Streptomyces beigongshangae]|uniref:STAS domain-containing protein n=1 Tax=Streptomyces beigongshangae TaxID=2841597 RepID=UPI001C844989|nr:STAS domain-containing protein [Streptomyces sp. REN17]